MRNTHTHTPKNQQPNRCQINTSYEGKKLFTKYSGGEKNTIKLRL